MQLVRFDACQLPASKPAGTAPAAQDDLHIDGVASGAGAGARGTAVGPTERLGHGCADVLGARRAPIFARGALPGPHAPTAASFAGCHVRRAFTASCLVPAARKTAYNSLLLSKQ